MRPKLSLVLTLVGLGCLQARPALAITGAESTLPTPSGVMASGTLPVMCGVDFMVDCSGVALSSRLALTAAHCIASGDATGRPQMRGWDPIGGAGDIVDVIRTYVHPSYVPGERGADVAIVALSHPLPAYEPRLPDTELDPRQVGSSARVSGYGASDGGAEPSPRPRSGTIEITGVTEQTIEYGPGPNLTCVGDSGGPLIVETESGDVLAGIISGGDASCQTWGTATRLDTAAMRSFVEDVVRREDDLAKADDPRTATPADAESSCVRACATDAECAPGMRCVSFGGTERHCVPPGLPPGEVVPGPCADDCDACVQLDGLTSPCSCYRFCPLSTRVAEERARCTVGAPGAPSRTRGIVLVILLAPLLAVRRAWFRVRTRRQSAA